MPASSFRSFKMSAPFIPFSALSFLDIQRQQLTESPWVSRPRHPHRPRCIPRRPQIDRYQRRIVTAQRKLYVKGWKGTLGFYNNPRDECCAVCFDLPYYELCAFVENDTLSKRLHGIVDDFEPGGWYEYIAQHDVTQKSYKIGSTLYIVDFTFLS